MKYRKEIDGLRAFAVLPVILFHAGLDAFSGGFVGVDIFFVISGYLITTIIVAEMEKGSFSLLEFYKRRARRILPALFFVMLCTLPFAWFLLLPEEMRSYSKSLVAVPLFVSNVAFYKEADYFDTLTDLKPLLHTWSLAVEEQYYILFPLFLLLTWQLGKKWIVGLLAAVAIISLVAAQWGSTQHPTFTFYMLPTRGFELLIGALISLCLNYKPKLFSAGQSASQLISIAGLVLIIYAVFALDEKTPFPSFYTLIPTLGAGLIVIFANDKNLVGKLLGSRLLVGIGLISYSAYLWHQPIIALIKQVYPIPLQTSLSITAALVLMSLFIAYLSWRFIEKPFRDKTISFSTLMVLASISTAIFFIVGINGYLSNGYPNRQAMQKYKDFDNDIEKLGYKKCSAPDLTSGEPIIFCHETNRGAINAAVIGDSHASDKFYGIEKNITDFNWALIGNPSCPPVTNVDVEGGQKNCHAKFSKIINYIVKHDEIETVVLSFYGNYPLTTPYAADHFVNNAGPDNVKISSTKLATNDRAELFHYGISETVKTLLAANKKVYLLIDIPELPFFPINCVKGFYDCNLPIKDVLERQGTQRKIIERLGQSFPQLTIFDPIEIFCKEDRCSYKNGDVILYKDPHHLTFVGSDFYGKKLAELFLPQQPALLTKKAGYQQHSAE